MNAGQITSSVLPATGAVVAFAAFLSAPARRIGQPPVIGQVLAGIALGPSVLGQPPGDPSSMLVPDEALPSPAGGPCVTARSRDPPGATAS
ncbi:hypothetical protein [Streptomyces sp. NPDC059894]|uniref:hypothetical protein n=1 Tax=unclassified Streptomyces TaxID=2593676 RepID=UPI003663C12C